ncbi:MAG: hypothetical protein R3C01_14230 [Planctomycetaceae bacterium]
MSEQQINAGEPVDRKTPEECVLSLSGGGFRATIYHLGVLAYLVRFNYLRPVDSKANNLSEGKPSFIVTQVYGISGGAILAAHMGRHWNDYCKWDRPSSQDSKDYFFGRGRQIVQFCSTDIRTRIVWRMILRWFCLGLPLALFCSWTHSAWHGAKQISFYSTDVSIWLAICVSIATLCAFGFLNSYWSTFKSLVRQYDRSELFKSTEKRGQWGIKRAESFRLKDCTGHIHILTTNLTKLELLSFYHNPCGEEFGYGTWRESAIGIGTTNKQDHKDDYPLSEVVAISSAFPPLIASPRRKIPKGADKSEYFCDGGVADNQGAKYFRMRNASGGDSNLLISDAGQAVKHGKPFWMPNIIWRNLQTIVMLMINVSAEFLRGFEKNTFSLRDGNIKGINTEDNEQTMAANIRTDLNHLSRNELDLLLRLGWENAHVVVTELETPVDASKDSSVSTSEGEVRKVDATPTPEFDELTSASQLPNRDWRLVGAFGAIMLFHVVVFLGLFWNSLFVNRLSISDWKNGLPSMGDFVPFEDGYLATDNTPPKMRVRAYHVEISGAASGQVIPFPEGVTIFAGPRAWFLTPKPKGNRSDENVNALQLKCTEAGVEIPQGEPDSVLILMIAHQYPDNTIMGK